MDYGALPPEINSGRMYAGPGAGSMLAAAAAWNGLAADLRSGAAGYDAVISALTGGPWLGPSAMAMAAAAAPYVAWMGATAAEAELAATQAQAAAAAYAAAFAATVPPPEIVANRALLMMLIATNFFGQNTPAIAATEAQYAEMWAQDAAAMYGYAASSAAATAPVTPFAPAPQTTNLAGLAAQGGASAQSAGSAIGGAQQTLSQLTSAITGALNSLASPLSSALGGTSSSGAAVGPFGSLLSDSSLGGIATGLITSYGAMPGWMGLSVMSTMLGTVFGPLIGGPMNIGFASAAAANTAGAAGAAGAAAGALGPIGAGLGGIPGLGGFAGLGAATSVGGLAVPQSWGLAAAGASPGMLGTLPMASPAALPLAGDEVAAGLGFPVPLGGVGGLGRAAAAGAGAGAAIAAAKYAPRLRFVSRPPAAGYSDDGETPAAPPPAAKYPVPASFPTNGHAPPGYQAAVIYVPTNGNSSANV
ncbi:PPE family protein [Mycobacterium sp. IEC1808]|uniref:PPE family protein n=1 Tax=Mycobacterium sp. IEC1808 TaxID=1743230 RepID=UPI000A14D399|nr:PPE family protein [Mycobacterium sp. IEC1808]